MRIHHSTSPGSDYRADIDGLRSIAVLSVFLFHLQPTLLPGGFLGVDVFFVISGYLISGIILREHHLRKFSFIHFYARRIKRIFPALFVVIVLSSLVATFLLVPETYTNFMQSARYASAQLANFFFSQEVDYFSEGFSGQPLLHTWSLGVEEQFYLFWPLLIFLCFRLFNESKKTNSVLPASPPPVLTVSDKTHPSTKTSAGNINKTVNKKIAGVLFLIFLVSSLACYILAVTEYNLAFYMFYTRAFEFCIGGFIALRILPEPGTKTSNLLICAVGILLLFLSFLFIKEEFLGISFLQGGVLVPCIGSALIIYANGQTGVVNRMLATKLPVSIGKISYSLYLYHWPVIIFYKLFSDVKEIGWAASVGIIIVSFVLSILSYWLIEQPARKSGFSDRSVIIMAILAIVGFALLFNNLEEYDTAPWRITRYDTESQDTPTLQYAEECRETRGDALWFYKCRQTAEAETPIIALVGDSHAPHFLLSLTKWAGKNGYNVKYLGMPGCPMLLGEIHIQQSMFDDKYRKQCENDLAIFETGIVEDPRVEFVLVAQRFDLYDDGKVFGSDSRRISFRDSDGKIVADHTGYYREQLAYTVDRIKEAGKSMVILKQVPIFSNIDSCTWEPLIKKLFSQEKVCEYDPEFIRRGQQPSIDFIDNFASAYQIELFDPLPYFDSPLLNGVNMYHDTDHLNKYGVQFLVPHFTKVMDEIIARKKKNEINSPLFNR